MFNAFKKKDKLAIDTSTHDNSPTDATPMRQLPRTALGLYTPHSVGPPATPDPTTTSPTITRTSGSKSQPKTVGSKLNPANVTTSEPPAMPDPAPHSAIEPNPPSAHLGHPNFAPAAIAARSLATRRLADSGFDVKSMQATENFLAQGHATPREPCSNCPAGKCKVTFWMEWISDSTASTGDGSDEGVTYLPFTIHLMGCERCKASDDNERYECTHFKKLRCRMGSNGSVLTKRATAADPDETRKAKRNRVNTSDGASRSSGADPGSTAHGTEASPIVESTGPLNDSAQTNSPNPTADARTHIPSDNNNGPSHNNNAPLGTPTGSNPGLLAAFNPAGVTRRTKATASLMAALRSAHTKWSNSVTRAVGAEGDVRAIEAQIAELMVQHRAKVAVDADAQAELKTSVDELIRAEEAWDEFQSGMEGIKKDWREYFGGLVDGFDHESNVEEASEEE